LVGIYAFSNGKGGGREGGGKDKSEKKSPDDKNKEKRSSLASVKRFKTPTVRLGKKSRFFAKLFGFKSLLLLFLDKTTSS
jgi:hypothetical protein